LILLAIAWHKLDTCLSSPFSHSFSCDAKRTNPQTVRLSPTLSVEAEVIMVLAYQMIKAKAKAASAIISSKGGNNNQTTRQ
jgi:hypothetical protein